MARRVKNEIDRCSPVQLAELLGLAAADEPATHTAGGTGIRRQVLLERLAELMESDARQARAALLRTAEAASTVEELRRTMEEAKTYAAEALSDAHWSAATLLYHLAIAAAYAHHGVNLSARPPSSRLELYEDLASSLGADSISAVFRLAADKIAADRIAAETAPAE
jgi:hypothetical protein